jgi:hypothetical protein
MEVPDLSLSSILSLDNHVSIVDQVKISSAWHSRDNVEISFNEKTVLLVEVSFLWLFVLIKIDNLPLLSELIALSVFTQDYVVLRISIYALVCN